jgi:hypothetical protein
VGTAIPNSEVRRTGIFGVLKLTLSTDAYAWQFVPVAGQFFTESGSGVCHGAAHAPVAAVHVSPSTDSVIAGTTVQLSATASDASGFTLNHAPMTWRSTDTVKAKVAAGLVTGLAAGTVYVIATSGDKSDTASVTITAAPVASVVVTPAAASVGVGGTVALTATTLDHAGAALSGRLVIWSTSAPGVASVSGEGVVTGVAAGSAAVTATSEGQSASAVVTVTAPVAAARAGWHVAPGGASGNDGSSGRPWSLAYALAGAAGRIQPGDTVWLRDGIYAGLFRTALAGAPGRPIVFRQHPGERATIDGNLRVDGPDVVFWGFEIMQSNPLAYVATKVPGLLAFGARTKFINLVIHDASQQGITFWDGADDAEVYGCVVYNNGTHENLDHGIYVHHSSPATKVVADNVFFNNLAYGIHVYAGPNDATQRNVQLIGNVAFNNGSISAQWPERVNLLIGAEVPGEGMRVLDNMLYFSGSVGRNMWIGYTAANRDVEVRGNTVWGGATALQVGQWSSATIRDNRVGGTSDVVNLTHASVSGQSWSGNEYYRTPIALAWRYAGTAQPFTDWQQTTGLGLADAALPQPPAAPQAFVRPNKYEAGRALVVVYNWSRWAGVAVDLSGVLAPGERYEIRNVQALFGPPAASGTYAGGTVLIPMSGVAPPPRLGRETRTPPVTGPHFDAFIVTRVTS